MENKRRKTHSDLEVVQTGFANGVAPVCTLIDRDWETVKKYESASANVT